MRRLDAELTKTFTDIGCTAFCAVTGRVPYGYVVATTDDATVMEPDPRTAPVVRRIFEEYVGGSGLQQIAERLTADGILSPSAYDQQRNPHHAGSAWSKAAVRAVLTNDRYAARFVLVPAPDCESCELRCATRNQAPLVSGAVYRRTRDTLRQRGDAARGAGMSERRYLLRGLLRCLRCQRLMQGTWNNHAAYYRCRFPREYARANKIDHPANIYLREDRLVVPLQDWICRALPVRLFEWAGHQSPAVQARLVRRAGEIRQLVGRARDEPDHLSELFAALGMQLAYDFTGNLLRVDAEVMPGAAVHDRIRLGG